MFSLSLLCSSKDYGKNFTNVTNLFPSYAVLEWYYISADADKVTHDSPLILHITSMFIFS